MERSMWSLALSVVGLAVGCGLDTASERTASEPATPELEVHGAAVVGGELRIAPAPVAPEAHSSQAMEPSLRAAAVRAMQAEADERYAFTLEPGTAGTELSAAHPSQDLRVSVADGVVSLSDKSRGQAIRMSPSSLNGTPVQPAHARAEGPRLELVRGVLTEWGTRCTTTVLA